ncbi:MAG: alpha/beta hydrolase-fold protein [Microbacterium sp.]|uniref:alpha/beta hydrolase n=1 Tax=Microbacterium sp. TaxID=51671 RepID=UPI0039E2588D
MRNWLLSLPIIDGPLPWIVWALTAAVVMALGIHQVRRGRWRRSVITLLVGAVLGCVGYVVAVVTGVFGSVLPGTVAVWGAIAFAGIAFGALCLFDRAWWAKALGMLLVLLSAVSGVLGINAVYGIDRNVGALFGIVVGDAIELPTPTSVSTPSGPIYQSWTAPDDMPAEGTVGILSGDDAIPSTAGFAPRDASIYLPPAALVDDPPALPVVVMMMGQPGNPDASFVKTALDQLAAENDGLAPIVIVADQLGDPASNPGCVDSTTYGGVSTYFNVDIPEYIRSHLNVLSDSQYWTIAGYSNGGTCAYLWGAEYPTVWHNFISISGEEQQGSENVSAMIATVFGGDQDLYNASTPVHFLTTNAGQFSGHLAAFTYGEKDTGFGPGQQRSALLSSNAGFAVDLYSVPGAEHGDDALSGGLLHAFETLYPVLGLSAG